MAHLKNRSSTVSSAPPTLQSSWTYNRSPLAEDEKTGRSSTLPASLYRRVSQNEFVDRIKTHAQETPKHALYPGENYSKLAQFISRGSSNDSGSQSPAKRDSTSFATLYLLSDPTQSKDFLSEDLQIDDDLRTIDSRFRGVVRANTPSQPINEILFLRGFPSSRWLSTIGSYYRVDPEFFRRHLDFSLLPYQNWFSTPSLPSSSDNVVRIRITSLARRSPESSDVEKARAEASEAMIPYLGGLLNLDAQINIGESIVRKFSLHNEKYCSLEQDISICCCKQEHSWTVIAWLDSGIDLSRGRSGPWRTTASSAEDLGDEPVRRDYDLELISVIRNEPRAAIHSSQSTQKSKKLEDRAAAFQQSRALLNLDYGRHFEGLKVYDDPFYTIIPMFKHKALAETQFLNLVDSVLTNDLESTRLSKPLGVGFGRSELYLAGLRSSHGNFVFHRELLESHARSLRENLWTIKARGGPEWPKSGHEAVIKAASVLQKDYEWLEQRARELADLCDRGMKEIHDKATLAESVKSNELAQQVEKLTNRATLLSVIYIPLSFTTGFFGMNFAVFGQGHLKIYWWVVVSVPVLIISITVFFLSHIAKAFKRHKKSRMGNDSRQHWRPWG